MYLDANNLYRWRMSQKLPVNGFKWPKKDFHRFNKEFTKTMMKIVIKDIFLKQMLNILKIYIICTVIYHFYQKE